MPVIDDIFAHGRATPDKTAVVQRGRAVSAADLKGALQAALPGLAAVRVHAIEAMPRGDTGKIERARPKAQVLGASG